MLSGDVLTTVLSYVPESSIGNCFLVCKSWVRVRARDEIWTPRSVWGGWKETRKRRIAKDALMNIKSEYVCKSLVGHKHMVTCVELSEKEPSLMCTSSMSEILLWRNDEKVSETRLPSQGRGSPSARISPDVSCIIYPKVSSYDGLRNTLVVQNIDNKTIQQVIIIPKKSKGILSGCCDCQFSQSNSSLASLCYEDGSIVITDKRLPGKSSCAAQLQTKGLKWYSDLQLSSISFPTEHTIFSASYDRCVRAYDLRCTTMTDTTNKTRGMVWCQEMNDSGVENVVTEGSFVYVGLCSSNDIFILDKSDGEEVSSFSCSNFNTALAVNCDGLICNSANKNITSRRFCHNGIRGATSAGKNLKPIAVRPSSSSLTARLSDRCFALDIAISRDSSSIVAGYNDSTLCVWRPALC